MLYLGIFEIKHRATLSATLGLAIFTGNLALLFQAMRTVLQQLHQATGDPAAGG
jgi:hypothetical protein